MKVYCGTDIIEVKRIKNAILSSSKFKEKIFTKSEINCAENKNDITKYQYYAGRFAAKEAVYKALSSIYPHITLGQIEILNDVKNLNRPTVIIHNNSFNFSTLDMQIDVSISHIQEYATANSTVVLL